MNLKVVLIIVTLLATATLPLAIRFAPADKLGPSFEKSRALAQKVIPSLKAKQADVEHILKTKKCVGCNLTAINLSGADLSGADFRNSDLSRANLTNAKLKDAERCRSQ